MCFYNIDDTIEPQCSMVIIFNNLTFGNILFNIKRQYS